MQDNPKVTFVIPIFNSGHFLKDCFESIKKQDYSKNKIEVICPDGGSKDNGPAIVKKYGYKVIKNPKVLAEPGFMLGAQKASGELIVYMGADNRLVETDWLIKMVTPFMKKEIIAAYPHLANAKENTWLTKYFNTFTDPVNHFVLGACCNPLYFDKAYRIMEKTNDFKVYDFKIKKFPMLAFDQGMMVRKSYKRPKETEYDDILPILDMIEKRKKLAYVFKASSFHFTLEKGMRQFSKKMRWIIDVNLFTKSDFGFPTRSKKLSLIRKAKFFAWPFYSLSIVPPIIYACYGLIRDRKKEWIYHPQITYIVLILIMFEIVRVGILKRKSLATRQ